MTRILLSLIFLFLLGNCIHSTTETTPAFAEHIVELSIQRKDNQVIELPSLYDSLSTGLPEQSALMLAKILKQKGFKEINSGRGNYPPRGPRIVTKVFQKKDCLCEVSKIYYFTTHENVYQMAERIHCWATSK